MTFPPDTPPRPARPPFRSAVSPPVLLASLLLLAAGSPFALTACRRASPPPPVTNADKHPAGNAPSPAAPADAPVESHALPDFEVNAVSASEGTASWYEVPDHSLPRRRAWPGELTAASDRVPPGTYVRVRRLDGKTGSGTDGDGGKGIIVRVTDDGVQNKETLIDLNHEAATALGMVKAGQVRVRVEVLALKNASADKPVDKKDAGPAAPMAGGITDQPAANVQQEKDAANAKTGGQSAP